ncbi:cyclophilin-like domain-containing protein [Globomyces pollinis-pini]|nr:cyclophilin-like domain-containing protein [Globomyces pollinis-pini]
MGKKTDKMYMTASEWENEFGGAKKKKINSEYKPLPFSCCALTMVPFEHPVCTTEGMVFDLLAIVPWLKKHGTNPVTGLKLDPKSLIKMHWDKNSNGEYQCPITFKIFSNHTHIVCIKTTGNVYCMDAVEKLNIKTKYFKDLLTDEPFTRKDIIHIQDPHNLSNRNMLEFDYIKQGIQVKDKAVVIQESLPENNINQSGTTGRILAEMAQKKADAKEKDELAKEKKPKDITPSFVEKTEKAYNAAHYSNGLQAYSLTSMSFTPSTKLQPAIISDEDYMFTNVKENGHIQIKTNVGEMNFELYCKEAPRTCYNMIQLAKQGYYDNTTFHRSIRNFMLQGGDPTGTGAGGKSYWGTPFVDEFHPQLKHIGRGMLSMANRGRNTNTSQFFITYASCPHLNNKHSLFGKLVGGMDVLDQIEGVGTTKADTPLVKIEIITIKVFTDPFELLMTKDIRVEQEKANKKALKEKKIKLMQLSQGTVKAEDEIGKYLPKKRPVDEESVVVPRKAPTKSKGFGNFDSW